MKIIDKYTFTKNKRVIAVKYITASELLKRKKHKDDCVCLVFDDQADDSLNIYLRPDECLIVARLLTQAVFQITQDYNVRFTKIHGFTKTEVK